MQCQGQKLRIPSFIHSRPKKKHPQWSLKQPEKSSKKREEEAMPLRDGATGAPPESP